MRFEPPAVVCTTAGCSASLWCQADYVDQQKLRAAGLKVRLSKLAQERRLLDQEQGAALAAKQAELARLEG